MSPDWPKRSSMARGSQSTRRRRLVSWPCATQSRNMPADPMRRGTSAGSSAKSSNVFDHMTDRITFRPARLQDFEFCQRLFFEGMGWIIEALCLDMARQHESFASQWKLEEV